MKASRELTRCRWELGEESSSVSEGEKTRIRPQAKAQQSDRNLGPVYQELPLPDGIVC